MSMVVGLTGGICSGKTLALKHFAKLGALTLSADDIAKSLIEEPLIKKKVISYFGPKAQAADQSLDRAFIREKIFTHPKDREWLNALLHPKIRDKIREAIKTHPEAPCIIIEIPLLTENKPNLPLDRILVILAEKNQQIARVCARYQISPQAAQKILDAQAGDQEREEIADDIIINDGEREKLEAAVLRCYSSYTK